MSAPSSQQRQQGLHVPQVERILPGPAGKLQQLAAAGALHQATPEVLGLKDYGSCSTQANTSLQDGSFQSAIWSSARDFVAQEEARTGAAAQLHTIKMAKDASPGKVPQMLVMLGSFKPSGAGSAFSKVKDPTGSMGAAIHSSALQQQQQLGPGCVLLLQQVSVFTPAPGTTYMAVTAQNIARVWGAEPPTERMRNTQHHQQQHHHHRQQQQQQQQQQQSTGIQAPKNQQPGLFSNQAGPSRQQQQQQRGNSFTQQQQWQQQQQQQTPGVSGTNIPPSFFPPPSPDVSAVLGLRDNSSRSHQQQRQQPHTQQHQPHQLQEQQGEFSPAVPNRAASAGHVPAAAAAAAGPAVASAAVSGSNAAGLRTPASAVPAAATGGCIPASAKGSMPPPPPRIQPSSFTGLTQKLQQTQQQQQQQQQQRNANSQQQQQHQAGQPASRPGANQLDQLLAELGQFGDDADASAAGSGGGSMAMCGGSAASGGQAAAVNSHQQVLGGVTAGFGMGSQQPGRGQARGPGWQRQQQPSQQQHPQGLQQQQQQQRQFSQQQQQRLQQQHQPHLQQQQRQPPSQQWQQHPSQQQCIQAGSQQQHGAGSPSVPHALLGHPKQLSAQQGFARQPSMQQQPTGVGVAGTAGAAADQIDDVVAAIFGSQLAPSAAAAAPPAAGAAPPAGAGSSLSAACAGGSWQLGGLGFGAGSKASQEAPASVLPGSNSSQQQQQQQQQQQPAWPSRSAAPGVCPTTAAAGSSSMPGHTSTTGSAVGEGPQQKRFKPSGGVIGAVLPGSTISSQQHKGAVGGGFGRFGTAAGGSAASSLGRPLQHNMQQQPAGVSSSRSQLPALGQIMKGGVGTVSLLDDLIGDLDDLDQMLE